MQERKDNESDNEEQQQKPQQKGKKKRGGRKRGKGNRGKGKNNQNDDENDQNQQTKQVQIMEDQVNEQQDIAQQNMDDIQGMLDKLSTSPNKSILKNKRNPNYAQEQQNLNDSQLNSDGDDSDDIGGPNFLGAAGNRNKARGPPSRKDTKKKKRKKKHNRDRRRPKGEEEEEDDENKQNEEEEEETMEQRQKRVKFEKMRNKKVPKNIVEVTLENRKGNKRVTIVRGFIEKSKDKEQRIKSEFMKKFATSCMITFQNQGADKGPKQVVLMGDKRYDFMKYLKDKFPKAGKLLYYKTKKYGLTPAVDPDHGFVMPPP